MEIKLDKISKTFNNDLVLNNLSYKFSDKKIYGIVGRNGSGKSVLLKIICGLYNQDSGEVLINGKKYDDNQVYQEFGIVIESPSFIDDLSGFENLKLLASINDKISDEDINYYIDIVGLKNEKNKKYSDYSMGMCQKLAIAQAIMEDQDIILLDEPFNGIDRQSVDKIKKYLVELKNKNKIIIMTTHILDDVKDFCDVILKIEDASLDNYD